MADENPLLVGNRALSRTGHAAMAMKGTDNEWINIQMNTFNNWVNEQLREADLYVEGLGDFCDGVILCALVEILQGKPIGKVIKNPTNHHQMLHNATLAFNAIASDVKLVNIGPEDVIAGNGKLILGLIWQLILHYQIGKTKFPPKKLMMAWLQAVIPDCNVTNFTRDWNNGVALHGLIDYCKPGLSPEWKNLDRNKGLENCRSGMALAKKHFNIPLVLRPEDLSSRELDELSGMTYLFYYMKQDSPGYHATLNWVKDVSHENVKDFTTDWNDGRVLSKLVSTLGGDLPPLTGSNVERIQTAMDAGRLLGVEPLLTAREMADVEDEHLGIMAYAASFGHLQPVKRAADCVKLSGNFNNVHVASESNFNLKILDDAPNHSDLRVQIKGPSGPVTEHLIWHGKAVKGRFTPTEPGMHEINVFWKNQLISDCPVSFPTVVDVSKILQEHPDQMVVGNVDEIKLDASQVSEGGLIVEATSPSGRIYDLPLTNHAKGQFVAKFLPQEPGDWSVNVMCNHELIPGSPFKVKVIDPSAVTVNGLSRGAVTIPCTFNVDCSKAGEADLKVDITHNENYVPSTVSDNGGRVYSVTFTPPMAGDYNVNVTYGNNTVKGSPFSLDVVDFNMVRIETAGMKLVPVDKPQTFFVDTSNAGGGNVNCTISGPDGQDVPVRVKDIMDGVSISWLPRAVGDHTVNVDFAGYPIKGSPFKVKVYDPSSVGVSHVKRAKLGKPVNFELDIGNAGAGNLEIAVGVDGINVPHNVQKLDATRFELSFLPEVSKVHDVSVRFNGDHVPGSPFPCKVIDASQVGVKGDGVTSTPANHIASFMITPQNRGPLQDCTVHVTSPSGHPLPVRLSHVGNGYKAEYTPKQVGEHQILVTYDDTEIPGNPFVCHVYDPEQVHVSRQEKAYLGKPMHVQVDTSVAGSGVLESEVMCRGNLVDSDLSDLGHGRYELSFTPLEQLPHVATITYNGDVICGGPFHIDVYDSDKVTAHGPGLELAELYKPTYFDVDPHGPIDDNVKVTITTPSGNVLYNHVTPHARRHRVSFTPDELGPHDIQVTYGDMPIQGSPFTLETFDPNSIYIRDVDKTGRKEREVGFVVDARDAGPGDLDVSVSLKGRKIPLEKEDLVDGQTRYMFTPIQAGVYDADVAFNDTSIPGAPIHIEIQEEVRPSMIRLNSRPNFPYERNGNNWFVVEFGGRNIDFRDILINVTAPNGAKIPCDIVPQSDGDYRVQWTPTIPGRYTIDVLFGERQIQGSPFYVDVFDISKIRIGRVNCSMVGETATFDIDFCDAGKAEYALQIIGPAGMGSIPHNIEEKEDGLRVTFNPTEPGRYKIYVTYGGLEVPDCPIIIDVEDGGMPTTYGDGLVKGEEDKLATFFVDAHNLRGELAVQVEGPNSIAKCTIEERSKGTFAVSYVPVEVGLYNVIVKWNGKEIPGSPFHPSIVDARKVRVVGGWQHYMDNNDKVHLVVNEEKRIPFDVGDAGPGQLSARVVGPNGTLVPVHIDHSSDKATVTFTARQEGTHQIHTHWCDHPLVDSPFIGHARISGKHSPDHTKVILSGRGLKEAIAHEKAEFHIDGSEAGPGKPDVRLEGVKRSIDARLEPLGGGKYRCEYIATVVGAYLLHITWNGRTLRGSPFKVNVLHAQNPQRIQVTGEGLRGGMIGKDISVMIDTRNAGKGELSAHCMGPNVVANCTLTDMRDGTYKLSIHPQESGRHTLHIKYAGEHVFGSPYVLMIYAQPDASKVRVSGPGVEHGILAKFESKFIVETRGAGAGQLTVRIKGPKGAFQVEMTRDSQKDRTIACQYTPMETGLYIIHIRWSGVDVPGSPFYTYIVDSQNELEKVLNDEKYNGIMNNSGYM